MKNINLAVLTIKEKGVANSEQEFNLIFNTLQNRTEKAIHKYLDNKFPFVPLDRESVITYCLYEWLNRIIKSFDESKGDFVPFFFATLNRGIINALQPQLTKKNEINLNVVSTELDVDDDGTNLLDLLQVEEPEADFSDRMLEMIEQFCQKKGEQAKQVLMCFAYLDGQARTKAICKIYGVTDYNSTIRKRVERLKKDFASMIEG